MIATYSRRSSIFAFATIVFALELCNRVFAQQLDLIPVAHATLRTEYFDMVTSEYKLNDRAMRAGGALAVADDGMVMASADGDFVRIDPKTWTYQTNYLPSLPAMGADSIKASKRYTYQELSPRVHALVFFKGSFYVSYDQYRAVDDHVYFVISELKPPAKRWHDIYRSPGLDIPYYALGGGGVMVPSPADNRLYFAVGDYSLDRINHLPSDVAPQNPNLPFGKINYIDLTDYSNHLFTMGHRNQLGLALLDDGRLLESENGPRGGDELNFLEQGKNYGWPYKSYGTSYSSFRFYSDNLSPPPGVTYEAPMYVFIPSIAPTQLVQIERFDPEWDGDILLGSLAAQSLYNIKIAEGHVIYCEPIRVGARIRDLLQFGNSFMMLTDTGTIIEMKKDTGAPSIFTPPKI